MQVLTSVTFVYVMQQDRVLAAVNAGTAQAWSCWLTRRVVLALLERAAELLAKTSALAQRVPVEARGEIAAFEHQAAMEQTAPLMRTTPADALAKSVNSAELVDRLSITHQGDDFRLELRGVGGGGAAGALRRAGFQRVLQMLQDEVAKAGWLDHPQPQLGRPVGDPGARH
jgi:hypothetical protein